MPPRPAQAPSATSLGPAASPPTARLEMLARLRIGLTAVVMALVAQLLIAGIQVGLDQEGSDFPAPILAMAGVFLVFSILSCIAGCIDELYRQHLKPATELLNRHMSIGFTVPVVMLCRGPLSDARSIGMIIICFVITGLFNTVFAYCLAFPLQYLMVRYDSHFWVGRHTDAEKGEGRETRKSHAELFEGSPTESSVTIGHDSSESSSEGDEQTLPANAAATLSPPQTALHDCLHQWAFQHPILLTSLLLTITAGIPLRCAQQADVPLATFLLTTVWLTTLALQTALKTTPHLAPWQRTLLLGLSNPVLWTSLAMTCYILADAALSHRPLPAMLDTLQTDTPLSTLIARSTSPTPGPPPATMAAGDIAITVLNSGLVAWGLKLFEQRASLVSRAGLAVCTASAALALGNVAGGPLLAGRALGVAPAGRAVAFAARNVTIALAGPVMGMLRGDAGLNAAMVVGSGIVYQMAMGFGVGRWLESKVVMRLVGRLGLGEEGGREARGTRTGGGGREGDTGAETGARQRARVAGEGHGAEEADATAAHQRANDPRTVAAGVTVGINAAAMGAAYLYEAQSEAAPHAALAMIALGIMTVLFASIPPLARWVVASATI